MLVVSREMSRMLTVSKRWREFFEGLNASRINSCGISSLAFRFLRGKFFDFTGRLTVWQVQSSVFEMNHSLSWGVAVGLQDLISLKLGSPTPVTIRSLAVYNL
jgi:hypothetical protein